MKSVLISIQPKWVEKIANGEKTIEVRKSVPKCEVPFKCYIYCTKSTRAHVFHLYINGGIGRQEFGITGHWRSGKKVVEVNPHLPAYRYNSYLAEGKVIGEFVCDKVYKWECKNRLEILESFPIWRASYMLFVDDLEKTCLTYDDLWDYGKGKPLYGLHISNLKIYDKPKELSEFYYCCKEMKANEPRAGKYVSLSCYACRHNALKRTEDYSEYNNMLGYICKRNITRPPQSWQYVEELEE